MNFDKNDNTFMELIESMRWKHRWPEKYNFWETNEILAPTGQELIISGNGQREVVAYLAKKIGGEISSTRKHIKMPDGKFWFCNPVG